MAIAPHRRRRCVRHARVWHRLRRCPRVRGREGTRLLRRPSDVRANRLRLGAAIGTTSLDYLDNVIEPDNDAQVYNNNAAAKAAFDAGQVDGVVFDLPAAYFTQPSSAKRLT